MEIKTSVFIVSNSDFTKCPETSLPEYAFIGRSNVGKSSLINMITNNFKLAKTSGRPGKTQLINHFLIDEQWYLVDLPGYGWARVSKEKKELWAEMIKGYLLRRENLICVFVLIDSRLEPQEIDLDFLKWLGNMEIPFVLVFTKADKQSPNKTQATVAKFRKKMLEEWEEMPQHFITSSEKSTGREEILGFISETNKTVRNS
ncbi:MAG: ribosome biogenesis GTP-binding protein YihA/YsxC [Bacteroidota bacterium]|nr:ribosome biogenesis GTP-binding protein YihA/YsxC [Bacteroidota bacterium]